MSDPIELTSRAEVTSHDEVGMLAERINLMTSKLQDTLEGLRRSELIARLHHAEREPDVAGRK